MSTLLFGASKVNAQGSNLPQGPRGALWQTMRYVHNPLKFYLRCVAKYGDAFTVPTVLGPVVVISRPSHLRTLFSLPPSAFERWSVEAVSPLLGDSSVLLTSGDQHLQQRRLMAPAFHKDCIKASAERIATLTRAHAACWPQGRPFRLQDKLVELSIEVILCTVLGIVDAEKVQRFRDAILNTLAAMGPKLMLARAMHERLAVLGPYARFTRARDELDRLLFVEIDAARSSSDQADHMLNVLLGVRDESGKGFSRGELRDQLMTLIFAGHETSAIALTWCIYWLKRYPATLAALSTELDGAGDWDADTLARLPYLDAVCKETLRLYPTVAEVVRKLKAPLQLDGMLLPTGMPVAACIVAAHHREDIYPDPGVFMPERFLQRRYAAHEYLPFGGGVHRCAGEAFAWLEMKVILATLITRLRFSLTHRSAVTPVLRSITMAPRGGVSVMVEVKQS